MNNKKIIIIGFLIIIIYVYNSNDNERWYKKENVIAGKKIYLENCISCHKINAQGISKWKEINDNGYYPPPPLNGSAHSWHHSLESLKDIISNGGKPYDGLMPSFNNTLNKNEIKNVISYFQSFWNNEIYNLWQENEK